jgi:tRNA(His) guanylyltransferase
MSKDDLGDRMKLYEGMEAARRFMPRLPIVARMDGRGFSKFTKGMLRPYDQRMQEAMLNTTKRLMEETHACMGYTQSDEITLAWYATGARERIWFDGRVAKMTSQTAALATIYFYEEVLKLMPEFAPRLPTFDSRVWVCPTLEEAANAFLWRERDATKNSVSMAASSVYSHNELYRKTTNQQKDMLMEKGINWNNYSSVFKRGAFFQRKTVEGIVDCEELAELPPLHKAHSDPNFAFQRSRIMQIEMPVFDKVTNRADVIFKGAEPILFSLPELKVT